MLPSKTSKTIKYILDEFVPPVIRDRRWFYGPIVHLWNRRMDLDFKVKALTMTDEAFGAAYEALVPMRSTDNTPATLDYVAERTVGQTVLEVGCGNGDVSYLAAKRGHRVMATDLAQGNLDELHKRFDLTGLDLETAVANVEDLPFDDDSFDTTICLHTLEHVRRPQQAIAELKRVTRQHLILIVPRQRYFRYTADYHLNFYGDPEQLALAIGLSEYEAFVKDFCICYCGFLNR